MIARHILGIQGIRPSQYRFIKGRPCFSNLISFYDSVTRLVDEGKDADVVYLEFRKTFDTLVGFSGQIRIHLLVLKPVQSLHSLYLLPVSKLSLAPLVGALTGCAVTYDEALPGPETVTSMSPLALHKLWNLQHWSMCLSNGLNHYTVAEIEPQ